MFTLIVTGCVKDVATDPDDPNNDGPRVLRITGAKITTLNQHIYETNAESAVMGKIYGNLLEAIYDKPNETYKIIGNHAVDLPTRSEDGLTWTFKVRDGLTWDDGTPITAETYEQSYKILLDPKLANTRTASFTEDVSILNALKYFKGEITDWSEVGIKALDKNTLELKLEFAIPEIDFYMNFWAGGPTSPIHTELFNQCYLNEEKTENNYGTSFETTPSSGPYELVEWVRDQYRRYEKRENYPVAQYYVPTTVEERVVEDASTRLQLFENGETDYLSLSGDDYDKYAEDPRIKFSTSSTVWSLFINMKSENKPFLTDINFRKAMYFAMPRETIANDILKTAVPAPYVVSTSIIADADNGILYRDTEQGKAVMPKNNGYDVEFAKECMQQAFADHGKMEVELSYSDSSDNMKRIVEFLELEFEQVFGTDVIDVVLKAVPWQTKYEDMETANYDIAFGAWGGSRFNPWSNMIVYTKDWPIKIDQFMSDEFDALYERTVKGDLIFKPTERLNALAEMEQMLFENIPFVPTFQSKTAWIFSNRVHLITDGKYDPAVGFGIYQSELDPLVEGE